MSKRVMVQYLGRTDGLTLSLPFLSEKIVFQWKEGLKVAKMWDDDAEKLIKQNPKSFRILQMQPDSDLDKFEEMSREELEEYAMGHFNWNPNDKWKDDTVRNKLRQLERESFQSQE